MRKWVVIIVLFCAVGGILVFALLRDHDSIEYHKREYLKARRGWTWGDEVRHVWRRTTGRATVGHRAQTDEDRRRIERHKKALLALGYLEERTFIVSNRLASEIAGIVWVTSRGPNYEFTRPEYEGTNIVRILALKQEMPQWEKLVRNADAAPE